MDESLYRSLRTSIEAASGPELKDVLRRIQSRCTAGSELASAIQGCSATSRASDLADLVRKACKVDKRCVPVVEEVLRANEQDRYSLREALFDSSDEDAAGPERLAFEVSSALRKRERKEDREDPAAASRKKRPAIPGAFKHTYPALQKPNAIIDLTADSSDSDPDSDESEIEEIFSFSSSSRRAGAEVHKREREVEGVVAARDACGINRLVRVPILVVVVAGPQPGARRC
ncbi:hypothetical protein LZ554_001650 [Drepanopeziza brunnea f. sp. 'monogermtubi']|nr:hypothetical protein LZ554_001650 [Drepanopeziza brunnea f. sp. 'monogermtubi']